MVFEIHYVFYIVVAVPYCKESIWLLFVWIDKVEDDSSALSLYHRWILKIRSSSEPSNYCHWYPHQINWRRWTSRLRKTQSWRSKLLHTDKFMIHSGVNYVLHCSKTLTWLYTIIFLPLSTGIHSPWNPIPNRRRVCQVFKIRKCGSQLSKLTSKIYEKCRPKT